MTSQPINKSMPSPYATLLSTRPQKYPSLPLHLSRILIGRSKNCTIQMNDKRLSGVHLEISWANHTLKLIDRSTNGCYINGTPMNKNEPHIVTHDDQVALLHEDRAGKGKDILFTIQLHQQKKEEQNEDKEEGEQKEDKEEEEQMVDKEEEYLERRGAKREEDEGKARKKEENEKQMNQLGEEMHCGICLDLLYETTTILECLHSFCGGCLSQWLIKSKECPQCRTQIGTVKKNPLVNNIVSSFLVLNPDQKRTPQEYTTLSQQNTFIQDKTEVQQFSQQRRRKARPAPVPPPSLDCQECRQPRSDDQFQCSSQTDHLHCSNCQAKFPERNSFAQKCVLCQKSFCNLYRRVSCSAPFFSQLRLLGQSSVGSRLDSDLLNKNEFELRQLRSYLQSQSLTPQDLFAEMTNQPFDYHLNRNVIKGYSGMASTLPLEKDSPVCGGCFPQVWFQMVLQYLIRVYPLLPAQVHNRPRCYYGINCNTMQHKYSHAQNYSHASYQTRF